VGFRQKKAEGVSEKENEKDDYGKREKSLVLRIWEKVEEKHLFSERKSLSKRRG